MTAMNTALPNLDARRKALGMSVPVLAARSGVSEPTIKRMMSGGIEGATFSNVEKVLSALGVTLAAESTDPDDLRSSQARKKAETVARIVQGTSALEGQAVDASTYARLIERSYHELLAGSSRRLWSQ